MPPQKYSFPKKERLSKNKVFLHIFKHGNRLSQAGITITYLTNSLEVCRAGFCIPASAVKKANRRNRTRRLLKEAYRINKHRLKPGLDIIITTRKELKGFNEAEKALSLLFKKAGLLS